MSEPWDELPAVIMDNGSGNVKCGIAGGEVPTVVFPAVTSHPRSNPQGPVLVGDRALAATGQVYKHPLEHGIVTDWDGLERLWRHAYDELHIPSTERAIVVTEAPLNPTKNRERMAELLFESFQVPALNFQIQAVMTMYSAGRVDGLVVDSGDGITHTVPIFEGRTIAGAIRRSDIAGRDLTEWMMELLNDEVTTRAFTTSADRELARTLKESSCRVSVDFEGELEALDSGRIQDEAVTLPDGSTLSFPRAKICCPELLFNPQIAERHASSLQQMVHDSIQHCPIDIRRALYGSILLSGGTTMFPNTDVRLKLEVAKLANKRVADDVKVAAPNERKYTVWMGAALVASLSTFHTEWFTRQEYLEEGVAAVHGRCDSLSFVDK